MGLSNLPSPDPSTFYEKEETKTEAVPECLDHQNSDNRITTFFAQPEFQINLRGWVFVILNLVGSTQYHLKQGGNEWKAEFQTFLEVIKLSDDSLWNVQYPNGISTLYEWHHPWNWNWLVSSGTYWYIPKILSLWDPGLGSSWVTSQGPPNTWETIWHNYTHTLGEMIHYSSF